jgi:hypothetical protein
MCVYFCSGIILNLHFDVCFFYFDVLDCGPYLYMCMLICIHTECLLAAGVCVYLPTCVYIWVLLVISH